jgi:hypothetical protein
MPYLVRSEVLSRLTPAAMDAMHRFACTETTDATEADTLALGVVLDMLRVAMMREGPIVAEALNEALAARGLGWRLVSLS